MAWIYVVGEHEDRGPVKIGMTQRELTRTGRASLSSGNHRRLLLLDALEVPLRDLRWTEWRIHRALAPWHKTGEWFAVRPLLDEWVRWRRLLRAARADRIEDGGPVDLGRRGHRLLRVERVGDGHPLQFRALCSCGAVLGDGKPQAFLPVVRAFCRHADIEVPLGVGANTPRGRSAMRTPTTKVRTA